MNDKSKKYLLFTIASVFLIYGLIRLGVSSLLLLQLNDVLQIAALEEGLNEVAVFMAKTQDKALLPISSVGYLSYLFVMAVLLVVGALAMYLERDLSRYCLVVFLVGYVALFVNFQTVNPKVIHLIICSVLFGVSHWCMVSRSSKHVKG